MPPSVETPTWFHGTFSPKKDILQVPPMDWKAPFLAKTWPVATAGGHSRSKSTRKEASGENRWRHYTVWTYLNTFRLQIDCEAKHVFVQCRRLEEKHLIRFWLLAMFLLKPAHTILAKIDNKSQLWWYSVIINHVDHMIIDIMTSSEQRSDIWYINETTKTKLYHDLICYHSLYQN